MLGTSGHAGTCRDDRDADTDGRCEDKEHGLRRRFGNWLVGWQDPGKRGGRKQSLGRRLVGERCMQQLQQCN